LLCGDETLNTPFPPTWTTEHDSKLSLSSINPKEATLTSGASKQPNASDSPFASTVTSGTKESLIGFSSQPQDTAIAQIYTTEVDSSDGYSIDSYQESSTLTTITKSNKGNNTSTPSNTSQNVDIVNKVGKNEEWRLANGPTKALHSPTDPTDGRLTIANNGVQDSSNHPDNDSHGTVSRPSSPDQFGDRERTEERYDKAIAQLEESLKLRRPNWEALKIPDFKKLPETQSLPQLQVEIKKLLDARKTPIKAQTFWSKSKITMERIFTATSPFAKNFLQIAKEGVQVCR
jgi:hypothetical protein